MKEDGGEVTNSYFTEVEFLKQLRTSFGKAKLLVGFNLKYDLHWARRLGVQPPEGVRIWDCQTAEFLLRGQQGSYPSLDESLARFNLGQKDDKVAEYWKLGIDTEFVPADELKFYCDLDVELTYKLYLKQQEVMPEKLKRLCMVMGLDLLVLAEMEWNGVKFNVELSKQKAAETAEELKALTTELRDLLSARGDVNFGSPHQLSCLLYGGSYELTVLDYVETLTYKSGPKKGEEYERSRWRTETVSCEGLFTPLKGSETKLRSKAGDQEFVVYATGEDVLRQLRTPTKKHKRVVEVLLALAEKEKLLSTYYQAIPELLEKMEWGDVLHGQLNQCVARTGRLSSSNPNMQNFSGDVDLLLVTRF